jgi:5'-3' exonuclease
LVHLIDASVWVFRAYFSLPDSIRAPDGRPMNAVWGFAGFLGDLLDRAEPSHIAACFDESLSTSFRNERFPEYKANREPAPDELKAQFADCKALCQALGVLALSSSRYEADDIIATLVARARRARHAVTIVSRDKDLAQLLGPDDLLWDFAEDISYDAKAIEQRFGVPPARMTDWQGLVGDAVDNIPGVRGVGPKAATALIREYSDLEGVYANLEGVAGLELRGAKRLVELLKAGREQAFVSRELATLHAEVPIKETLADLSWKGVDRDAFHSLATEFGLGHGTRQRISRLK